MNRFIRTTLAALVVATAGIAASAPAAHAAGFELSIGGGGIVIRDTDRRDGWDRGRGHDRDGWDRGRGRSFCNPGQAVEKARHMGVRRAEIIHGGRRQVVVEGYRHHRPVRVAFANERNCPVIGFRR